jgi:hypothetical protein
MILNADFPNGAHMSLVERHLLPRACGTNPGFHLN